MSITDESNGNFRYIPVGPLGIIATQGSKELSEMINSHIVKRRREFFKNHPEKVTAEGFIKNSFLISTECIRFATGEGKAKITESVRGHDIFILSDPGNYSCKYKLFGMEHPMSPDDHFQDIKRVISAIGGKARRITVIMPLLYEGRQHKRLARESLDCAVALQELERLGVDNIITFDAHDPRVQNAIPLAGFENLYPHFQIIRALLETEKDLIVDRSRMIVVSPDEGGMERNLYYANILGLDLSTFYKRRDYTKVVNGKNPIIKHEYLGEPVEGKDVLICDDIISSGESMLDIAIELKKRKARNIYLSATYALFTEGIQAFDKAYEEGIIKRLYATNLTYRRKELLERPWYVDVDMSDFLAYLIDVLNFDQSISPLIDPSDKINKLLKEHGIRKD